MTRSLVLPSNSPTVLDTVAILSGGTGATTAPGAISNLAAIPASQLNQPGGVAGLGADGKLDASLIPVGTMNGPTITGVNTLVTGVSSQYTITNYDVMTTYTLSVVGGNGSVSRSGDVVTYTAGGSAGAGGFVINGKTVAVTVTAITINQASITSPANGATGLSGSVAFTGGAFGVTGGSDTHEGSDWQIATDAGFTNVVSSVTNDAGNKLSWTGSGLSVSTTYYARVRYKGVTYGYGVWSSTVSFTTKASFIPSAEEGILSASDKAADKQFGGAVSISSDGSRVAIGSRVATSGGLTSAGQIYIFLRTGTTWAQEAILSANDKAAGDMLGQSVSMSSDGSRVVVGAHAQDGGVTDAGAAYIFLRTGSSWAQEAKILASDRAASDFFGQSVSISSDGSRVVVGADYQDGGLTNAGAAYIFLRTGNSWAQEAKIVASDRAASDFFGVSVAMSGDGSRVVVGAYLHDGGLTDAGAAYIFLRTGTSWAQEAKIVASDRALYDSFGISVAISDDGSRVVVGAHVDDSSKGAAYIFLRNATTWTQEAKLLAIGGLANDYFGWSVSISSDGSRVAVGARWVDSGGLFDAGAAYIFLRSGTSWTQEAKLDASNKLASSLFGYSVAVSGDGSRVVIGARDGTINGVPNCGTAYIFG